MLRATIYALLLLHLGAGIAFALLTFGCDGRSSTLGSVCFLGVFKAFGALTMASWLVLGSGAVAGYLVGKIRRSATLAQPLRLAAFAALLMFGCLVGASVQVFTGSQLLYLAIPASLAVGWLFVANPYECGCAEQSVHQGSSGPGAP